MSVLLTAMAFAGREEHLVGTAARDAERAFAGAERAAWTAFAALVPADSALGIGNPRPIPVPAPTAGTAAASATRLAPALFTVTGEAAVRSHGGGQLTRRVGIFIRFVRDSTGAGTFEPLPDRAWAELP